VTFNTKSNVITCLSETGSRPLIRAAEELDRVCCVALILLRDQTPYRDGIPSQHFRFYQKKMQDY
jgi:hypothetical protein